MKAYLKFLLPIFFISGIQNMDAQIYLEPILGYSFSKNIGFSEEGFLFSNVLSDGDFGKKNIFFGGGIREDITNKISLNVRGQGGSNIVRYFDGGFVGYSAIKFKRLSISVLPNWQVLKNFDIGIGIAYDRLYGFEIGFGGNDNWFALESRYNQNQIGWISSLAYNFKSIVISVQYREAHSRIVEELHFIKKTKIFDLSLAYRFKVESTDHGKIEN